MKHRNIISHQLYHAMHIYNYINLHESGLRNQVHWWFKNYPHKQTDSLSLNTVYCKSLMVEKFCGFHWLIVNSKSFPAHKSNV